MIGDTALEHSVPLFFLMLRQGSKELPNDHEPQEFPDLAAARIEAVEAIRELSSSRSFDGIDILDRDGKQLLRVTSSEVLEPRVKKR
jgi:hypothetical protein